jgi:hypothetical protein
MVGKTHRVVGRDERGARGRLEQSPFRVIKLLPRVAAVLQHHLRVPRLVLLDHGDLAREDPGHVLLQRVDVPEVLALLELYFLDQLLHFARLFESLLEQGELQADHGLVRELSEPGSARVLQGEVGLAAGRRPRCRRGHVQQSRGRHRS